MPSHRTEMLGADGLLRPMATCAVCHGSCAAGTRFCESCGAAVDDEATPAPSSWELEVVADVAQFERMDTDGLVFPVGRRARTFGLAREALVVGRSRPGDVDAPDIDLSGELADPAVSRRHVRVELTAHGELTVTDLGSTNGTTIDDGTTPVRAHTAIAVEDGTELHLGAWTTIVVRRAPRPAPGGG